MPLRTSLMAALLRSHLRSTTRAPSFRPVNSARHFAALHTSPAPNHNLRVINNPLPTQQATRTMATTTTTTSSAPDWSPDQYLLFRAARNRPITDLLAFLGPSYSPQRIVDIGCGPGNSTELLRARFPSAALSGMDSSPAMLERARAALPETLFELGDVRGYVPPGGVDLLFSNAVFHWLRREERIPTVTRLLLGLEKGTGVLAFQVPDNHLEPSRRAMGETAASPGPWTPFFAALAPEARPDIDPIESHLDYYNALSPHCRLVETWTTRYVHVLEEGHKGIVEWVRGTGLQPYVNALPETGGVREAFLEAYEERLEREYPVAADGRVLLAYPRRFVVAFR